MPTVHWRLMPTMCTPLRRGDGKAGERLARRGGAGSSAAGCARPRSMPERRACRRCRRCASTASRWHRRAGRAASRDGRCRAYRASAKRPVGILGAGDRLGVVADQAIAARQRGDELGAILEAGAEDEPDRRRGSGGFECGERGENGLGAKADAGRIGNAARRRPRARRCRCRRTRRRPAAGIPRAGRRRRAPARTARQ